MNLEEFRQVYLRLCKDHRVEPQDCILNQLTSCQKSPRQGGYCLNLSTHSLTVQTCAVLAKVLTTDRAFQELKFNDCMIPEEGMKALAHGFTGNVACKKLDLKGNNIRGTATEGLGRMLRQNRSILSLCLEWNAMGMLDTSFSVFCEGLGSNTTLQVLDLRNNQINHDGATEIGAALKRNTSLRALDLRWNNIGLIGGRALLNAMDYNKTIVKLELAGNNIPTDILRSIETAVSGNSDRASMTSEFQQRQHMLSEEIQILKKSRHTEMTDLLNKLERQEAAIKKTNRSAAERIAGLQSALEERKEQFNTIAAKFSLAESELALSESKVSELSAVVNRTSEEHAEIARQHQMELKREREDRALVQGKLQKELISVNEKNMDMDNKIDELERKCKSQQETIFDLKEQLTSAHAEGKLKASQFEEKLQFEKQKLKDAYRDNDEIKMKEMQRIRQDADDTEKLLKERIQKLELTRIELEEEISRLKNNLAADRLQAEEQLSANKQRMKHEEEQRCQQLQEKIRMLTTSKDELQSHSSQQASSITELQAKNANLVLENETLRHRIDNLNKEVAGKNNEVMAEVNKVQLELNQKIQKLEQERQSQSDLYDKISRLERELADGNMKQRALTEDKDREIFMLTERLKTKEAEIRHMIESDGQRMAMLQSAFQSYATKSPFVPR